MTPFFTILTFCLLLLAGWLWTDSKGGTISLTILAVITLFIATWAFEVKVKDNQEKYYEERVPNLQQYLDDYEVAELEAKILKIKEGEK